MEEIICKCGCGRKKLVRSADVKRGWGLFFNKSCKAKYQNRRRGFTNQYKNREDSDEGFSLSMEDMGEGMVQEEQ